MLTRTELTHDELVAIVESLFSYNGKTATSVRFMSEGGSDIESVRVVVECDEPGLKIRIAPEGQCCEEPQTPEEIARSFSNLDIGNGH
jgi:hypothetical protein